MSDESVIEAFFKKNPLKESDLYLNGVKLVKQLSQPETSAQVKQWKKQQTAKKTIKLQHIDPAQKPKCFYVSKAYKSGKPPEDIAKHVLSWPVPNERGEHVLDICFYVREVQEFIVKNDNYDEHARQNKQGIAPCPMFEGPQIQAIFNTHGLNNYTVPQTMDLDFQSAFIEFDMFSINNSIDQSDSVSQLVMNHLQNYVISNVKKVNDNENKPLEPKQQAKGNESTLLKVTGFFWYATKKSLSFLFTNVIVGGAKLAIWLLRNPSYLRIVVIVARTLRVVLCVISSFNEMQEAILEELGKRIIALAMGFGQVIWDYAMSIIKCVMNIGTSFMIGDTTGIFIGGAKCAALIPWESIKLAFNTLTYWVPDSVRNWSNYATSYFSNTFSEIGGFMTQTLAPMMEYLGVPVWAGFGKVMSGHEAELSDIVGLGKNATLLANLKLAFQTWDPTEFEFAKIIMILDFLISVIDILQLPQSAISSWCIFVLHLFPRIGSTIVNMYYRFQPAIKKPAHETTPTAPQQTAPATAPQQTEKPVTEPVGTKTETATVSATQKPASAEVLATSPIVKALEKKPEEASSETIGGWLGKKILRHGSPLGILRFALALIRKIFTLKEYQYLILAGLEEIRLWFTDLFPCLMRRMGDMFLSLFSFGTVTNYFTTPGDLIDSKLPGTCCMAPIIRQLQKQFVFGELDRRNNVAAQELKKKRSELSWWDYLSSGEGYQEIAKGEKELRGNRRELSEAIEQRDDERYQQYSKHYDSEMEKLHTMHESLNEKLATGEIKWDGYYNRKDELFNMQQNAWDTYQKQTSDIQATRTNYTTRGLGDTLRDMYGSMMYGSTITMVPHEMRAGIPCVDHEYVEQHQIPGTCLHMKFQDGNLAFYLCMDKFDVNWLLSRQDMITRFPKHVHVDRNGRTMLPLTHFTSHQRIALSNLPTPLVRF